MLSLTFINHCFLTGDSTRFELRRYVLSFDRLSKAKVTILGGKDTTLMTQLLGQDAHVVTYGAMSKQPLSFPTPMFIFKNLQAHGFWQSRWYERRGPAEQEELMKTLVQFMSKGQVCARNIQRLISYGVAHSTCSSCSSVPPSMKLSLLQGVNQTRRQHRRLEILCLGLPLGVLERRSCCAWKKYHNLLTR